MRKVSGKKVKKTSYPHTKRNFFIFTGLAVLLFMVFFHALNWQENLKAQGFNILSKLAIPTITPYPTDLYETELTQQPTPTAKPAKKQTAPQQQYDDWGKTVKIDEHTSASRFGADDHMSTVGELNAAMNQYRASRGLSTLNNSGLLCDIAQKRANENQANGKLDTHAGFGKYAQSQQEYNDIAEVLFGGAQPVSGVHIVEWGWDQSLTGHREAISNPKWQDGCAGIAGYFAVYIFGKH